MELEQLQNKVDYYQYVVSILLALKAKTGMDFSYEEKSYTEAHSGFNLKMWNAKIISPDGPIKICYPLFDGLLQSEYPILDLDGVVEKIVSSIRSQVGKFDLKMLQKLATI